MRGPIAWMARHGVAANLLMFVVVVGGILGALTIKQEIFPQFSLDLVTVQVAYPGASPSEVEQGIVLAVEEELRSLEGVKRVTASASEGGALVTAELLLDADPDKVLADAKAAVDRITSFPEDAERPVVSLATRRSRVVSLVIAGELPLTTLHELAEEARARLLARPELTQVSIEGLPPLEVSIEVPRERLEALGLSLDQVARQVAASSLELPGGSVVGHAGELLVRVADRAVRSEDFARIVLRGTRDGARVRLGDVATIRDGFADADRSAAYDGRPAVRVTAYRVGEQTPQEVADAVREVARELEAGWPASVRIAIWDDDSELLRARLDLLMRNARLGMLLVLATLALFLDLRLAFWVALGIPVSFLGALLLMPALDVSVNMISLFALIVTLGMVVDDAIIVGENAFEKHRAGGDWLQAAIEGAREMAAPVTFAVLTSVVAFAPMLFVPGTMGKVFRILPLVVGSVLLVSLVESFFVLPAHLAHGGGGWIGRRAELLGAPSRFVSARLERFVRGPYRRFLVRALRHRYLVLASATASLVLVAGLVGGRVVPFSFFPRIEGNLIGVTARLPYGVPVERTEEVRRRLEAALSEALDELGEPGIVRGVFAKVGEGAPARFGGTEVGSHLAYVEVALVPGEERRTTARQLTAAWKRHVPDLPGVESLVFDSAVGPHSGAAVDVQLSHPDPEVLARASEAVEERLRAFPDLTDIESTWAAGKPRLDLHLLPAAASLGLTGQDLARQLRAAFYGAEALREQRGRNEVRVVARLPESQRRSAEDLADFRVRTPDGGLVPLSEVASWELGRAPTTIQREDGRRVVDVKADLAPGVRSAQAVRQALEEEVLPEIADRVPGLSWALVGEQREQGEAFASLGRGAVFALFVVYAMLAIPFRSYTQPLLVMLAIPLGVVGAVLGHLVMGYELSIVSLFGLVALAGVIVNDSLVLIDTLNRYRREGRSVGRAVVAAASRRVRPILLTSLTTFFGLMPMILESSIQARFLVPMAITLGFGVLVGTVVALVVTPSTYLALEDLHRLLAGRARRARRPARAEAA